ncbi:MAG: 30S ribosomal protein S16 [Spirochaetia bacterium]|nr:30S ribosomal protein S16 [Spirochaetia bacterium]
MVRLRLQRYGTKKRPFYRLVAAHGTSRRDGRFIEQIGFFDPVTRIEPVRLNSERVKYWLEHGAVPSLTVQGILKKAGAL